jgi:hypothetical protein
MNCQSTNVAQGSLHSTGKLSFRPKDAKFLKLKTANVDVDACLCLDCGSVFLKADRKKTKQLTDEE